MIWGLFAGITVGAALLAWLMAKLQEFANRLRSSDIDDDEAAAEPVKHTEPERVAALAALDPDAVAVTVALDRMEARLQTRARIFDRRIEARLDAFLPDWRTQNLFDAHDFAELRELTTGERVSV